MRFPALARWLVLPAATGLLALAPLRAAEPAAQLAALRVRDVALDATGTLSGIVQDSAGLRQAQAEVRIISGNREVARALTNAEGRFQVAGLQGGLYQVATGETTGIFRVWAQPAAPPGALASISLTTGDAVRGQSPPKGFFKSDALLISAAVLGAVAIPIAIFSSSREQPPGS